MPPTIGRPSVLLAVLTALCVAGCGEAAPSNTPPATAPAGGAPTPALAPAPASPTATVDPSSPSAVRRTAKEAYPLAQAAAVALHPDYVLFEAAAPMNHSPREGFIYDGAMPDGVAFEWRFVFYRPLKPGTPYGRSQVSVYVGPNGVLAAKEEPKPKQVYPAASELAAWTVDSKAAMEQALAALGDRWRAANRGADLRQPGARDTSQLRMKLESTRYVPFRPKTLTPSKGWAWRVEFGTFGDGEAVVDGTEGVVLGTRLLADEPPRPRGP